MVSLDCSVISWLGIIVTLSLLLVGCRVAEAQHLIRPSQSSSTLQNTVIVPLSTTHCASIGALDGSLAVAWDSVVVPFAVAVRAVTFTPLAAQSTIPSGSACGGSSTTPRMVCTGDVYQAAFYCNVTTNNAIQEAGGSPATRLIAVSQDSYVDGSDAPSSVTLAVARRLQTGAVCRMQLLQPRIPAANFRLCGRLDLHVSPMWNDNVTTTAHGVASFVAPNASVLAAVGGTASGWVTSSSSVTFATDPTTPGVCDGNTMSTCIFAYSTNGSAPIAVDLVTGLAVWTVASLVGRCDDSTDPSINAVARYGRLNLTSAPASLVSTAAFVLHAIPNRVVYGVVDILPPDNSTSPFAFLSEDATWSYTVNPTKATAPNVLYVDVCVGLFANVSVQRSVMPQPPCDDGPIVRCAANPFCRARSNPGVCCWNGAFVGPQPQSSFMTPTACMVCDDASVTSTPTRVWDRSCRVARSSLYLRNLVSQGCTSVNAGAACQSDSYRCNSADLDAIDAVNTLYAATCVVAGGKCPDPSLVCEPSNATFNIGLVPSTPAPTAVPGSATIKLFANVTSFRAADIRTGAVWFSLSFCNSFTTSGACITNVLWNTTVSVASIAALTTVTPDNVDGRFDGSGSPPPTVVTGTQVSDSGTSLQVRLGPLDLAPGPQSDWKFYLRFTGSNALWLPSHGSQLSFEVVTTITIEDTPPSTGLTDATFRLVLFGIASGFAGGFTGWIGIAALQTTVSIMTTTCTPMRTFSVFDNTYYVVTPMALVSDDPFTFFLLQSAIIAGVCIVHLAAVGIHFFFVTRMSFRNSTRAVGFPSSALYAAAVLLVGTSNAAYLPIVTSSSNLVRIATFVIGVTLLAGAGVTWIQVLRRGSERFYREYDLTDVPRVVRPFFPGGWWPEALRFTPVRSICHDKASTFTFAAMIPMMLVGISTGYTGVGRDACAATFTDAAIAHAFLFAYFLFLRPFRIPVLNLVWGVTRLLEIALNLALLSWNVAQVSNNTLADQIAWIGFAVCLLQASFNALAFIAITMERVYRIRRRMTQADAQEKVEVETKLLDAELAEAMAQYDAAVEAVSQQRTRDNFDSSTGLSLGHSIIPMGEVKTLHLMPAYRSVVAETGERRQPATIPPGLSAKPLTASCEVEMVPVPGGLSEGELMHVLHLFSPTDVHIVGASAFISLPSRADGLRIVASLDGRLFMGTSVACTLLDDEPTSLEKKNKTLRDKVVDLMTL